MPALVASGLAGVAYPVSRSGCIIAQGYTVAFGEHDSYMAKEELRVRIYPRGKTSVCCAPADGGRTDNLHITNVDPVDEGSVLADHHNCSARGRFSRRRARLLRPLGRLRQPPEAAPPTLCALSSTLWAAQV